jgi:hypothetical protein
MLPDEFRRDKAKVRAAAQLLALPIMREMLECLMEANPVKYPLPKAGPSAADHSRALGMIEGHWYTLETLKLLGTLRKRQEELRADFSEKL